MMAFDDTWMIADDETSILEKLREARTQRAAWEKVEKELRAQLMPIFEQNGGHAVLASGAPAAHLVESVRRTVNSKKLEALHPSIYAEVMEEKVSYRLDIDLS